MPLRGWMLVLCLWYSLLSAVCAASLAEGGIMQDPSPPRPPSGKSPRGRQAGSVWPFWTAAESKAPSFLSLPFSLPFDLWGLSTMRPQGNGRGAEGPAEMVDLSSSDSSLPESEVLLPDPVTDSTQGEYVTPLWTGTVALVADSDLPSPTATPDGKVLRSPRPHVPRLTTNSKDALARTPTRPLAHMPTLQTERPAECTTSHNSNKPALALGNGHGERREPTRFHDGSSTSSALVTVVAKPTSAIDQATEGTAGTKPKIDTGLFDDGMRAEEEKTEAKLPAGDGGAFEDVMQQPTGMAASVSTQTPGDPPPNKDWPPDGMDNELPPLPDCNVDGTGACNASGPWSPAFSDDNTTSNQSYDPFLLLAPPMFVPLYSDWNSAMATWGVAWEAHVYGLGSLFALVAFASILNLLCLPLRCPSGCGYFALVNLFLLTACCSRAFSLFYDAYSHQDKLPAAGTLLLYEVPFPCLTAAFGIVFLLLSMRSRMQLSNSVFQHPCFLAVLVLLHFSATLGSVVLLQVFTRLPCLFFVSQGSFVALAAFLSAAYFAFYCYVRADAKHIYHLNNTSPPAERYHRCPFADPKDWDRAAVTAAFSALFALACAGLQLYAMLHALGLGGVEVFHPWPWWAFHLSCRLCEAGVCLTLVLVVLPPLYCSGDLPQPGVCWPWLFCTGSRGHMDLKSPVLPNNYQWSLSQQEKLVICDAIACRESECLPLYTLVDNRLSSLDGLDLLYHGGRFSLCTNDDDGSHHNGNSGSRKSSFASLHLDSDSTGDLRPPSPINLRRSIDEALFGDALFSDALFSDALFPKGLFGRSQLRGGSSELSLNLDAHSTSAERTSREHAADRGLYRTSSCVDMEAGALVEEQKTQASLDADSGTSVEQWRGGSNGGGSSLLRASLDGSSLVLCSSPESWTHTSFSSSRIAPSHLSQSSLNQVAQLQRRYRALGSASQESLNAPAARDLAVQAEFISVCRQIDALSVCSDTIDL
ncbi:hypothetical protein AAFF_G00055260 [Aldrovandia affinis]|uniref:Proline-rich transmembrane protein 3/4 domain-containing protein n=1 Tax=Aldrovandia affinis TaxID=143900 RepID=A0AAD7S154_9TELE|nr:hypothetical protein AAFF_G00055260 [Aldrovandia affinis]